MRNKLVANLVPDMYARQIGETAVHGRQVAQPASTNMADNTALSGKEHPNFDTHAFMKGFVAGLVLRNRASVRPLSPSDRRGFAEVIRLLDQKIDEFEKAGADR